MHTSDYAKERAVAVSLIAGNSLLMVLKVLVGLVGKSSALVADGLHSAVDAVASLAVFFSIKISRRPPDEQHPYGHGKIEAIAGGLTAVLLAGVAIEIGFSAVENAVTGTFAIPSLLTAGVALTSAVVNEAMFRFGNAFGKKVGSQAIVANSWDNRSDALSSLAAFAGILGARLGFPILDPIAALAVSIMILRVVYHLILEAAHDLMDSAIPETGQEIEGLSEAIEGVEHAYARVRRAGRSMFVDLKLEMDPGLSVSESHEIGLEVKKCILEEYKGVSDVMIHIHPHEH